MLLKEGIVERRTLKKRQRVLNREDEGRAERKQIFSEYGAMIHLWSCQHPSRKTQPVAAVEITPIIVDCNLHHVLNVVFSFTVKP